MAILADKVPFPYLSSKDAKEYVLERLLYRFLGKGEVENDDLDQRIRKIYKERYGTDMLDGAKVENVCFHGMPGVGKTSTVRAAAQEAAKLLGMRLISNPTPPYIPQPNDLVISTLEMSGEVSNIVMGGIPVSDVLDAEGNLVKFMNKLPLYQLAIMKQCRAPILLLDDFANAAPPVQNSALSIALEGRFQMLDLGSPYVAMTANLGALDNSDVSPLSDPMTGRLGHFYVEDELEDFVARARETYKDSIADANVIGFLKLNPNSFMLSPDDDARAAKNGVRTPYPSPRTWDKLINEMRIYSNRAICGQGQKPSVLEMTNLASAFVGKKVGADFAGYLFEVLNGAHIIASNLIDHGKFDEKLFKETYKDGISKRAETFGHQLAYSLSSHASSALLKSPEDIDEIISRFATGVFRLSDPIMMLSINDFAQRLIGSKSKHFVLDPEKNTTKDMSLKSDIVEKISLLLVTQARKMGYQTTPEMNKNIVSTISGASVYAVTYQSNKHSPTA